MTAGPWVHSVASAPRRPIRASVTAVHRVPSVASLPAGSIKAALTAVQRHPRCLGHMGGPFRTSVTAFPSVPSVKRAPLGSFRASVTTVPLAPPMGVGSSGHSLPSIFSTLYRADAASLANLGCQCRSKGPWLRGFLLILRCQ